MLSAHYRSPLNFSADLMEAAKAGLSRIVNAADNLKHLMKNTAAEAMTDAEKELFAGTDAFVKAYEEAMEDDFNTADAVSAVFDLVKYINSNVSAENSKESNRSIAWRCARSHIRVCAECYAAYRNNT